MTHMLLDQNEHSPRRLAGLEADTASAKTSESPDLGRTHDRLTRLNSLPLGKAEWQILCVTTARGFVEFGQALIASIEINSPDVRLVLDIIDGLDGCEAEVSAVCRHLVSVDLQLFDSGGRRAWRLAQETAGRRWQTLGEVLRATCLPTFLVEIDTLVQRDLTLLAVELNQCNVAFPAALDRGWMDAQIVTAAAWFKPTVGVLAMVDLIAERLDERPRDAINESIAVREALIAKRRKLRFAQLPSHILDPAWPEGAALWTEWKHSKIAQIRASSLQARFMAEPDLVIVSPRQDVGTKRPLSDNSPSVRAKRLTKPSRIYWRFAARLMMQQALEHGLVARTLVVPQWEITSDLVARLAPRRLLLPHLVRSQLSAPGAGYYMQELMPSLFTVDEQGWGASSSSYGRIDWRDKEATAKTWRYIKEARAAKATKAPQRNGPAPSSFDVLAILQVPGDDALSLHSDVSLTAFIEAVATFAQAEGVRVLFKKHPLDQTAECDVLIRPLLSENIALTDGGHVHDLIKRANAVIVINSGVGFEAMLYGKPVLTFGRAVYDTATRPVTAATLAASYHDEIARSPKERQQAYASFIDWFVFRHGIKIDEAVLQSDPFDRKASGPYANPIAAELADDLGLVAGGAPVIRITAPNRMQRVVTELLNRVDQTVTPVVRRSWRQTYKRYNDEVVSPAKSLLMPHLPREFFEGRSVALVGNAASLQTGTYGAEIDDHDLVIRLNIGYPLLVRKDADVKAVPPQWIAGEFIDTLTMARERHVLLSEAAPEEVLQDFTHIRSSGRRTNVWSCSSKDRNRQLFFAEVFRCRKAACHPRFSHLDIKLLLRHTIERLPASNYRGLKTKLGSEPTSGLLWFEYLRQTSLRSLTLYGFDFFDSPHINRLTSNLLTVRGKWPHQPDAERAYVIKHLSEDNRLALRGAHAAPRLVDVNSLTL